MKMKLLPLWRCDQEDCAITLEPNVLTLLTAIGRGLSLQTAAQEAGISYRHAWGLLGRWGEIFGHPLATMRRGRKTSLTPLGEALVHGDHIIRERLAPVLEEAEIELEHRLRTVLAAKGCELRLCASHDLALGNLRALLSQRGLRLTVRFCGSLEALRRLKAGECDIAGFHFPEGEWGRSLARRYRNLLARETRLLLVVRRRQGLMTAAGNPKRIRDLSDLARPGVRFINRQAGSGTRLAFDALLGQAGCNPEAIEGYEDEEHTHSAVAALIASGAADAGLGLEAAARRFRLNFIPLYWERYHIALPQQELNGKKMETLRSTLKSKAFREQITSLTGYDARNAGSIMPAAIPS